MVFVLSRRIAISIAESLLIGKVCAERLNLTSLEDMTPCTTRPGEMTIFPSNSGRKHTLRVLWQERRTKRRRKSKVRNCNLEDNVSCSTRARMKITGIKQNPEVHQIRSYGT
jgi:hypothetical protein